MSHPFGTTAAPFTTVAYLRSRSKWVMPLDAPLQVIRLRVRNYEVALSPRIYNIKLRTRSYMVIL